MWGVCVCGALCAALPGAPGLAVTLPSPPPAPLCRQHSRSHLASLVLTVIGVFRVGRDPHGSLSPSLSPAQDVPKTRSVCQDCPSTPWAVAGSVLCVTPPWCCVGAAALVPAVPCCACGGGAIPVPLSVPCVSWRCGHGHLSPSSHADSAAGMDHLLALLVCVSGVPVPRVQPRLR